MSRPGDRGRTRAAAPLTWRWRLLRRLALGLVRLAGWRLTVRGLEHLPASGGAVLVFNHHSYADFVMVGIAAVDGRGRPLRYLAKREIWEHPLVGPIARWGGAVPVDRASSVGRRRALDAAVQALSGGELVVVAPEQTISRSFELLPIRSGPVRMAQAAGVPVIAAIGWGSHRALTKGRRPRWHRGLPVTLQFAPPLHVRADDDPRDATAALEQRMRTLLEHAQRTYPDGTPAGADWLPERLGGSAPSHAEMLEEQRRRFGEGGAGT